MVEAAAQAGIHRSTLDRWEKGRVQPYLSELTALLAVLNASEPQKRQALECMDAPRAIREIRQQVTRIAQQTGIAPLPHGGDLLRAMRGRRGLSLEAAAHRMQISGWTLRRWEKMEVWPSLDQLHRLCYALAAHEEELVALTVGRFSQKPRLEETSLDALEQRLSELRVSANTLGGDPLFELASLQLEADAWPLALRSSAGKQLLIDAYAHHAQRLSSQDRMAEAGVVAERALELMTNRLKTERVWMYPVLVAARASVYRGAHPAPNRGVEILRSWQSVVQWPDMNAWMLADLARYLGLSGETEASLALAEEACRVAQRAGNAGEWNLRRGDKAALLLQAGRPGEALALVEERRSIEADLPDVSIDFSLLRAEAYLGVADLTRARDWLQRAINEIDAHHLEYKRPRAERIAEQL
jgi:transcriptional regulator with XRE-family HTH domain